MDDSSKDPRSPGRRINRLRSFREEEAMKIKINTLFLMAVAGLTFVLGQAVAGEIIVNCDEGDSVQKAIDAVPGLRQQKSST
jgi:hypothetical protein